MGFHPLDIFTSGVIYSTVDTLSLVGYSLLPISPPTVLGSSIVIWKSRSGSRLLLLISADIIIKIIVLEDTKEYIGYAPREETEEQDRRPFDLLVILNPQLRKKSIKSALFFEGCLRSF